MSGYVSDYIGSFTNISGYVMANAFCPLTGMNILKQNTQNTDPPDCPYPKKQISMFHHICKKKQRKY